jgi:bacterioferritin-associated ferredoxin
MDRPYHHEACDGCPEKLVCRCLHVTESQVIRMIERLELRTVRDLRQYTGAGDGCTCCHAQLEDYLEKFGCAAVESIAIG